MTDIDKLEAGPELDALVAEKVMGWVKHPAHATTYWHRPSEPKTGPAWACHRSLSWSPSTDIAAAFEVVEKLRETHVCCFELVYSHSNESAPYRFMVGLQSGNTCSGPDAPTAPLAICRAALKVVQNA